MARQTQTKTIGILGGVTWHSSLIYYQRLNQLAARGGDFCSADLTLRSVDFSRVVSLQKQGNLHALGTLFARERDTLLEAGAQVWAIASNTVHNYFRDPLGHAPDLPHFVSVHDALAKHIRSVGFRRVGLFGTRYVMKPGRYSQALEARGVQLELPPPEMAATVNRSIFEDLAHGRFTAPWKKTYVALLGEYQRLGVEAVILGCTEIPELMEGVESPLPLIDSVGLHTASIWEAACTPRSAPPS